MKFGDVDVSATTMVDAERPHEPTGPRPSASSLMPAHSRRKEVSTPSLSVSRFRGISNVAAWLYVRDSSSLSQYMM